MFDGRLDHQGRLMGRIDSDMQVIREQGRS